MKNKLLKDGTRELRHEKFANTPERCFIENRDIKDASVPRKLDQKYYIDIAKKRIEDFLV